MDIKTINKIAKKIAKDNDFTIKKEIYRGTYYTKDNLRNIIYLGLYKSKKAILKYYNDPRITDEPISLSSFLKNNKSKILTAPKIYKKRIISANQGWFIAEEIPEGFKNYDTPMDDKNREEFLRVYLEYRKYFPEFATRKLLHIEKLSPNNFHIFRINRWLELAQKKEAERLMNKKKLFLSNEFLAIYEKVVKLISEEFGNRKMVWCHGHFKPHEIFTNEKRNKFYLIDFAHSAMFPEGYELAFIIWSDYLMNSKDWNIPYNKWKQGVKNWLDNLEGIARRLKINNPKNLLRVSLIERVIGTVLADIVSSDRPDAEKKKGIGLMTKLLEDLL